MNGDIYIRANGVTIQNTRVHGRIDTTDTGTYTKILIKDVEVVGPNDGSRDPGFPAIGYTGFTCERCNVWGWGKGFGLVRDVTIRDSYVHDLAYFGNPANGGSHNEAVLSLGGSNFTLVGNRFDAGIAPNFSASVALYSQMEQIRNVVMDNNLLNGGGYCLYAGSNSSVVALNAKFRNNVFGNSLTSKCGVYGPVTSWRPGNGNEWSGNILQSTGAAITPPVG